MKKFCLIAIMFLMTGILSGCTEKQTIAPEPRCLSGIDANSVMKTAERVLVDMNFIIDKADPNLSIITTRPLAGGQFFEVWRQDNVGGYNKAMSSLHSIQRTVELNLNTKQQGEICIACKVKIEWLSIPEKQIDSTSRAYSMFSQSDESRQTLILNEEQEKKMDWVDIGRDNRLEKVILDKIEKKLTGSKGSK